MPLRRVAAVLHCSRAPQLQLLTAACSRTDFYSGIYKARYQQAHRIKAAIIHWRTKTLAYFLRIQAALNSVASTTHNSNFYPFFLLVRLPCQP
jgi:hypothetical protein